MARRRDVGAAVAGIFFLLLYYVANPPLVGYDFGSRGNGSYLVVDLRLIEALGLAVLAALPAIALYGLDRLYAMRPRTTKSAAASTWIRASRSASRVPPGAAGVNHSSIGWMPSRGASRCCPTTRGAWRI